MADSPTDSGSSGDPYINAAIAIANLLGILDKEDPGNSEVLEGIAAVGGVLNTQIEGVYQALNQRIEDQGTDVHEREELITRIISSIIGTEDSGLSEVIWQAANAITAWHDERETATKKDVLASTETISGVVTEALRSVLTGQSGLSGHVTTEADRVIRELRGDITSSETSLTDSIGTSNDLLTKILNGITNAGSTSIENVINIPSNILSGVVKEMERAIDGALGAVTQGINGILQPIEDIVDDSLTELGSNIPDTQDELTGIKDVLTKFATTAEEVNVKTGSVEDWKEALDELMYGGTGATPDNTPEPSRAPPSSPELAGPFANATIWNDCIGGYGWTDFWENPGGYIEQAIASLFSAAFGRIMVLSEINSEFIRREVRNCVSDMLLRPEEAAQSYFIGDTSRREYREIMKAQGYSNEDADKLLGNARNFASPFEYLHWWHRELIGEDQLNIILEQMRYNRDDRDAMKEASYYIPPAQDLITMAVREVFSPEARAANRQDDDYPPEFERFAGMQGISPEWAKNYWAAHWTLPSPMQGFEMLHRGVIEEKDLRQLLVALDIMPAWRQRLIDISFNPLTRVDVRRMHDIGVLDREQVLKAYKDLGYNETNAELMTEFTERYNAAPPETEVDEIQGITRGSILSFYRDELITRASAKDTLVEIGVGDLAAEAFLNHEDLKRAERQRRIAIETVIDQFEFGRINKDQARATIIALGFGEASTALSLGDIDRIEIKKTKLPSKADLGKFYLSDLIGRNAYKDGLVRLGYSGELAELYAQQMDLSREPEPEEATLAQLAAAVPSAQVETRLRLLLATYPDGGETLSEFELDALRNQIRYDIARGQ